MYKVYDNILPEELENFIYESLTSDQFPWYRSKQGYKSVTHGYLGKSLWKNMVEGTQLCHQFIHENPSKNNSSFLNVIIDMLKYSINYIAKDWNITEASVLRSKANIQLNNYNSSKNYHNPPHVDSKEEHLVLLYYVNNSDGDTVIFDDKNELKQISSITPEKGRLLVFNGNHCHASSPPRKNDARIVINTNIKII